jgi:Lipopolysaccharide-assembly
MSPDSHITRRQLLRWSRTGLLACTGLAVVLPACEWDGNFTILGYSTASNYDCKYKTVRVPIFNNKTLRRGLEFDLTEAVVREIQWKTNLRVVTAGQPADTELIGTITIAAKQILNVNQLNEIREGEEDLTVEIFWKDLKTGEILTRPGKRPVDPSPFGEPLVEPSIGNLPGVRQPNAIVTSPTQPSTDTVAAITPPPDLLPPGQKRLPADPLPPPVPVKITASATFVPELGQSTTSAYQAAINKMAVQIVSAMEKPW